MGCCPISKPLEQAYGRPVRRRSGVVDLLADCDAVASRASLLDSPALNRCAGSVGLHRRLKGLGPKPKLLAEVLVAACTVSSGIISPITPNFSVNWVLTVLWIVVISNAFNIIDNMDGLAGGVAIIGLAGIATLSGPNSPIGMLSILLMMSVGGFFLIQLQPCKNLHG